MVEIKGSAVLDSITGIKKRDGEAAYEALVSRLTGEAKKMFQSTVSGSSWYPLDYFLNFLAVELGGLGEWQRRSAGYAFGKGH
jgi:hypothetical protein